MFKETETSMPSSATCEMSKELCPSLLHVKRDLQMFKETSMPSSATSEMSKEWCFSLLHVKRDLHNVKRAVSFSFTRQKRLKRDLHNVEGDL